MSDAELVKRLLDFDKVTVGDARDAALRIEELTAKFDMAAEGWAEATRLIGVARQQYGAEKSRAEALTEQLEAARADAKEAEAYAEELARDLVKADNDIDDLKTKLAKAVEGLRGFMSKVDTACLVERDHPQAEFADAWRDAYAIIAEIEGEKT
jgi:chromosome segregation ATPase